MHLDQTRHVSRAVCLVIEIRSGLNPDDGVVEAQRAFNQDDLAIAEMHRVSSASHQEWAIPCWSHTPRMPLTSVRTAADDDFCAATGLSRSPAI